MMNGLGASALAVSIQTDLCCRYSLIMSWPDSRPMPERFEVTYHERTVGKVLHRLGFSHVSVRAHHLEADEATQQAFKKTSPPW